MGKADRTGRSKAHGRFIISHEWMMKSPAYRALSCYARCLLEELKRGYTGANNGDIILSVRQAAAALNVNKNTVLKATKELTAKGFIRAHEKGSFNRKVRHATTWTLTEYEFNNQPATKDFMRWTPAVEKQNTVPPDKTDGLNRSDRVPLHKTVKKADGPTTSDRVDAFGQADGLRRADTFNIPGAPPLADTSEQLSNNPKMVGGAKQNDTDATSIASGTPPGGAQSIHNAAPPLGGGSHLLAALENLERKGFAAGVRGGK